MHFLTFAAVSSLTEIRPDSKFFSEVQGYQTSRKESKRKKGTNTTFNIGPLLHAIDL